MMPIPENAYLALLRRNLIGAIMTVLFRRDCLLAVNGFDEALRRCEDYDIYLRITERYPIASHPTIVAEYRMHDQAMSNDHLEMLKVGLHLFNRETWDPMAHAALREGRTFLRNFYVSRMLDAASARWRARHDIGILAKDMIQAARWSPAFTMRTLVRALTRRASRLLPRSVTERAITNKEA
jgi:hypothetical protein